MNVGSNSDSPVKERFGGDKTSDCSCRVGIRRKNDRISGW